MADETTQAVNTTPTESPAAQAAAETTQPVTATTEQATQPTEKMTLEAALKELAEARKEAAKYRTTAKAAEKAKSDAEEAALKEQGKFKDLYERSQAELKKQADEVAKLKRSEMQRTVADRVKLPLKLASRLSGETEAEMEADAKEILSAMPGQVLGNDAKTGTQSGNGAATIAGMTAEQAAQWLGGVNPKHIH